MRPRVRCCIVGPRDCNGAACAKSLHGDCWPTAPRAFWAATVKTAKKKKHSFTKKALAHLVKHSAREACHLGALQPEAVAADACAASATYIPWYVQTCAPHTGGTPATGPMVVNVPRSSGFCSQNAPRSTAAPSLRPPSQKTLRKHASKAKPTWSHFVKHGDGRGRRVRPEVHVAHHRRGCWRNPSSSGRTAITAITVNLILIFRCFLLFVIPVAPPRVTVTRALSAPGRQLSCHCEWQLRQLMEVRCEKAVTLDVHGDVFGDRPSQATPVCHRRAPADLVDDHQRPRRGLACSKRGS